MGGDAVNITKRHLPHWTIKEAAYFVTFRTRTTQLTAPERQIVLQHLKDGNGKFYILFAAVVMPDHVHVVLTPIKGYSLSRIMKGIKGVSAKKLNSLRRTVGPLWQNESFDRIIRDEHELQEKLRYMLNNPLKKGLTDDPWSYHGWHFNENPDILSTVG